MEPSSDSHDEDLAAAARAFDAALVRLERTLAAAVNDVADLARRTGYADGHAAGLAEARPGIEDSTATAVALEVARARNDTLEDAVVRARAALTEAIDDIREALGPL